MLVTRALFAGALLGCDAHAARPTTPLPRAEAANTEPPTVPVLTYRPHPERDRSARAQYDQIDAELAAHFDYETGHQPAFKSLEDLRGGLFAGLYPRWRATLAERDGYETRIDHVIELQPTAELTVLALARRGSLSDSMWRGLLKLEQRGFVLLTPALHAAVMEGESDPDAVHKTEMSIQEDFDLWREHEMMELAARAIAGYAWAAVIARRHGVAFDSVRGRLEFYRARLGAEQFAEMVYAAPPPAGLAASYQRLVDRDLGLLPPASSP